MMPTLTAGLRSVLVAICLLCVSLNALNGSAEAAPRTLTEEPLEIFENVNVRLSGGESLALQQCLADAQDGVINTAKTQCNQIATAGNSIDLENVNLWVFSAETWWPPLFMRRNTTVMIMMRCLFPVEYGVIGPDPAPCRLPSLSDLLMHVDVYVYEDYVVIYPHYSSGPVLGLGLPSGAEGAAVGELVETAQHAH